MDGPGQPLDPECPDPAHRPLSYQARIKRSRLRKLKGYARVPKTAFFHPDKRISPAARVLYAIIHTIASKDGFAACRNAYLAETMGTSQKTVQRHLDELRDNQWIAVEGMTSSRKLIPLLKNDPESNGGGPH